MPCNCHHPIPVPHQHPAPRPPFVPKPPMPPRQVPTYMGPCCCMPLPPHYWHPLVPHPFGCCCPPPPPPGPWQYTPSHLYPDFFHVCNWPRFIPPFPYFMPNQPVPHPFPFPVPDPRVRW